MLNLFLTKTKGPKIFTIIFLAFIILQTFGFLFLHLFYSPVSAEAEWKIPDLQITIPGMEKFKRPGPCPDDPSKTCVPWIGQYIAGIYKYAIGVVGILAAVVLMFGGVIWITAGGSTERVGNAKAWIGASLTGLVLALTSYMILYYVNPSLTTFTPIRVGIVSKIITGCCSYQGKYLGDLTKEKCEKKENGKGEWGGENYFWDSTIQPNKCVPAIVDGANCEGCKKSYDTNKCKYINNRCTECMPLGEGPCSSSIKSTCCPGLECKWGRGGWDCIKSE